MQILTAIMQRQCPDVVKIFEFLVIFRTFKNTFTPFKIEIIQWNLQGQPNFLCSTKWRIQIIFIWPIEKTRNSTPCFRAR